MRIAVASFSLDVPDFVAQLGNNDGFDLEVRPFHELEFLRNSGAARPKTSAGGTMKMQRSLNLIAAMFVSLSLSGAPKFLCDSGRALAANGLETIQHVGFDLANP